MNNATILIIEDNEEIRENMAEILELSGYKVIAAANGKEGVSQAIEHIPALIVCDIMMPVLDGYGVIHMLQKNAGTQDIPFIFLSAMAERSEIRKGMDLGADDYIMKPFNGTELLNAIESRLRRSALLHTRTTAGLDGLDLLVATANGKGLAKDMTNDRDTLALKKKQVIYSEGGHPHNMYFVKGGESKNIPV